MKYIFVAGAPGSKWSSVVKNIYYSDSVDSSDHTQDRSYSHAGAYNGEPMHLGSYFDPGMEFGSWFDRLNHYTKDQCEAEFDRPFSGTGIRIIKSHMFMYHIGFLKQTWPDSPIILVHRGDDACLGWWVRCGGFNITYPDYNKYYQNFNHMADQITQQNKGLVQAWNSYTGIEPQTNRLLASLLKIEYPPIEYIQDYSTDDIAVKVI